MQTDKDASWLIDDLDLVIPFGLDYFCLLVLDVLNAQILALDSDFVPIVDATDIHALEVADCLNEAHPKRTVV